MTHEYKYKHTMAQVQYLNNSNKNYYTIYAQSQRPRGNLDKGGQQLKILIHAAQQEYATTYSNYNSMTMYSHSDAMMMAD